MSGGGAKGAAAGLRVGVTLYIRDAQQSLWENGIFQNCYFLLMLLNRSPVVQQCFVVRGGDDTIALPPEFMAAAPAPIITMQEAFETLDVVIELSAQLDSGWAIRFHQKGGRIIAMRVANDHVIDVERMIYKLPPGIVAAGTPYSEVWTLPAFEDTCSSYYQLICRAPVRTMPHLWNAAFIDAEAKNRGAGAFAYRPGRQRWRLAIMEPNICSVKTSHLPMLVCDVAHRTDPGVIEVLRVFNTIRQKEHAGFVGFAQSLDLVRQGIATFESRLRTADIFQDVADALVSHHWNNGQNYLYYEALAGGFPLIHNSSYLDGCGYRYRDFDCEDGAGALLQAFRGHDLDLDGYNRRARAFLVRLDPESQSNIAIYSNALTQIVQKDGS